MIVNGLMARNFFRVFLMLLVWCGILTTLNILLMFRGEQGVKEYLTWYHNHSKFTKHDSYLVLNYQHHTTETDITKRSWKDGYHFPKDLCDAESLNETKMDAVFKNSIMPLFSKQLAYCRVYKGGSTFWKRLLAYLQRNIKLSPFRIKPQDEQSKYRVSCAKHSLNGTYNILTETRSFMFTRNPYSRILSAYIDKLYSPNPYFWKTLGVIIMKTVGKNPSCGSAVTFRDLVEYIIQTPIEKLDDHFIPIHSICRPCQVNYHYIGKMENFLNDTVNIFAKFQINSSPYITQNFSDEYKYDAIYDTVQAFIAFRHESKKCMNPYTGLQRIWRKLQYRGIISENKSIPLNKKESQHILLSKLLTIISTTHQISKKDNLSVQRRKLFIQAYNTIPLTLMYKLQNVYHNDFKLFGYDPFPKSLFGNRSNIMTDVFLV
ncbi:carbohydrate sulfotransferase 12-like [Mytilus californianus]|uniref:carbohydrate sulfotransferase 12-like n=1 Tax=Mytilus californianus TaxID=6549 RepID=UPI002247061A|nr:carbohydrate sulfotransferase 12-like [Mytilus californianus]XP_052081812.1 carbohydrate sulfotransferase 12-like [Mytilus californianus]